MQARARTPVLRCIVLICCVLQASCGTLCGLSRPARGRAGPRGVQFVGVYEDRAELVPGLRSARTIKDLRHLLDECKKPGRTNVRARLRVVRVLSSAGGSLRPGDSVTLVFRSSEGPHDPSPLPKYLVGKTVQVVLHDPFRSRYYGRFSCLEWRGPGTSAGPMVVLSRR